ncbi:hypothetical protein P7K49_029870 [Saguinus oedipus]|uniref:Uncharacterized protein n=1 Tax=Saguinus oedipus TaxID=9490 RepID=A0ABQ9U8G0_SAGOE|nr:hypothetical protein P7K49_029870 [Saguinus oedipus]
MPGGGPRGASRRSWFGNGHVALGAPLDSSRGRRASPVGWAGLGVVVTRWPHSAASARARLASWSLCPSSFAPGAEGHRPTLLTPRVVLAGPRWRAERRSDGAESQLEKEHLGKVEE